MAARIDPENAMPAAASPDWSVAGSSCSKRAISKAGRPPRLTSAVTAWSDGPSDSASCSRAQTGTRCRASGSMYSTRDLYWK